MKKKILGVIIIITLLVVFNVVNIYISRKNIRFPHFKQVMLKSSGRIIANKDYFVNYTFIFVDEEKMSEMQNKANIESVEIYDNDNNKIKIEDWRLDEGNSCKDCTYRSITAQIKIEKRDNIELDYLRINYMDGVTEDYSIGDVTIKLVDFDYSNSKLSYNLTYESLIPAVDKSFFPYSGLLIVLDFYKSTEITINDFDLGSENYKVDFNNVIIKKGQLVPYDIVNERKNNSGEPWLEDFARIKKTDSLTENIEIKISNPYSDDELNQKVTLLLPLQYVNESKFNEIAFFDFIIDITIDGEKKKIFSNHVNEYFPPQDKESAMERLESR